MTSTTGGDDSPASALAMAQPNSVDGELVRTRLMSAMFGRAAEPPRFGRFELRERIGEGGMGVVYRAWDPQLERAVAIKLIDTTGFAASQRERALREARSLAKLSHPAVITVFEAGLGGQRVWIAMEYVPGTTMRDWLTRTPRPPDLAILRHWIAVGRGLVAVHDAGLIHRDVKPSNVLIGDDGRPRLIDFGLVRAPRSDPDAPDGAVTDEALATSRSDGFVGTRAYAPPEQLAGAELDPAADQYAFCVSVWESLCERRPPPVATPPEPRLSPRLHRALARGLALAPHDRFPALTDLLDELESIADGPSRRLGLLLGAGTLGALLAGVAAAWLGGPVEPPQPCAVPDSALAGTWDPPRRLALRERLAAGDLEFAASTSATLEAGLDDWSARWLAARRAACVATRVEGVQSDAALDLRDACLERKRRSLEVTLRTLLSDDASAARLAAQGPELLARLPDVRDCADPLRLAQIDPLPPEGPLRDEISRGRDALSEAHALAAAGALDRAGERITGFTAAAPDALNYAPLRLELAALPPRLELLRGRTAQGVAPLVELARDASARRLDELAADLWVEAAEAAAGHWSRPELERWSLAEADVALRRLGRAQDPRLASLRAAEAALLVDAGRPAEALGRYQQARTLALELGDPARAEAQQLNIAATLAELGRRDEARAALADGLAAATRRWGPGSPTVARHEFDAALLDLEDGDVAAARVHLDAAGHSFTVAFTDDSLPVARVRFARSRLHMLAGEFPAALAQIDRAFVVYVRELGPDHELLADLHEARGVLRFYTGDLTGSVDAYEAALRIQSSLLGPGHARLAHLHSNLGESLLAQGRLPEARRSFDRALAILGDSLPADHPELALPLKGRGQLALASGRPDDALADLERALDLQLTAASEPLEIADLRFSLARALRAIAGHDSPRTSELARLARAEFAAADLLDRVAAIDLWLRDRNHGRPGKTQ